MKIPRRSNAKIRYLYDEGFSLSELAIMYNTTTNYVEAALDDDSIYLPDLQSTNQEDKE